MNLENNEKTIFGHPAGLITLFFTEMWERFSFYGMRALLIIFMSAALDKGGFGFNDDTAGAIYGLYVMGVYLLALPGGLIADRLIGMKNAVWYGGIVIALGHFTMGIPGILQVIGGHEGTAEVVTKLDTYPFYIGLILVVLGTGLLKPNISAIVGELYKGKEGSARDAGFSIFYMGINIGAFAAPLICGSIAEYNWHLGFATAGFGMVLGLIQYKLTHKSLAHVGNAKIPENEKEIKANNSLKNIVLGFLVVATVVVAAMFMGIIPVDIYLIADTSKYIIAAVAFGYLGYVAFFGGVTKEERKKVYVIAILFVFAAVFWSGFEQAGSTLNLFADRFTNRQIFGWNMPAAWFQSANSMFIIIFAPFFGAMWVNLARKKMEPSSPVKFGTGLVLLGIGFLIMYFAAKIAASGDLAAPTYLLFTYMFHTFGELCLSPVGLSLFTKLAPKKFVGQMMGIWFLATSLGNLIAGLISGEASGGTDEKLAEMPDMYMLIVMTTVGAGLVLLVLYKPIRKLMGDVK